MPTPENPLIIEHQEVPEFSEVLNDAGITSTPVNVQSVKNNNGQPMITTPASINAKIQLPGDKVSLIKKAKGSVTDAATWLAKFLLRALAIKKYANNNEL